MKNKEKLKVKLQYVPDWNTGHRDTEIHLESADELERKFENLLIENKIGFSRSEYTSTLIVYGVWAETPEQQKIVEGFNGIGSIGPMPMACLDG